MDSLSLNNSEKMSKSSSSAGSDYAGSSKMDPLHAPTTTNLHKSSRPSRRLNGGILKSVGGGGSGSGRGSSSGGGETEEDAAAGAAAASSNDFFQCASCANSGVPLQLCGNCRLVVYCSKQCQQAHWFEHKKLCKFKNPTHFQPAYREKVQWFLNVPDESRTGCLVRAFKLRCKEEADAATSNNHQIVENSSPSSSSLVVNNNNSTLLKSEEIPSKFLRFLQAAKGARLLPENFRKPNFIMARNEAISKYKLCDLPDAADYSTYSDDSVYVSEKNNGSSDIAPGETEETLRILHTVICGPVLNSENQPNLI